MLKAVPDPSEGDARSTVPHDDEGAEAEPASAFHDLGHSIDVDDALLQLLFVELELVWRARA